jgi:hypothetical protein
MSTRYGVVADEQDDIEQLQEALNNDLEFIQVKQNGIPLSVHYSTHVGPDVIDPQTQVERYSYLIFYRYEEPGDAPVELP